MHITLLSPRFTPQLRHFAHPGQGLLFPLDISPCFYYFPSCHSCST
jgi:hypothetical protein